MDELSIIRLEWNSLNGLVFHLLHIELGDEETYSYEGSLFGINGASNFLYIDILWFSIKVFDNG